MYALCLFTRIITINTQFKIHTNNLSLSQAAQVMMLQANNIFLRRFSSVFSREWERSWSSLEYIQQAIYIISVGEKMSVEMCHDKCKFFLVKLISSLFSLLIIRSLDVNRRAALHSAKVAWCAREASEYQKFLCDTKFHKQSHIKRDMRGWWLLRCVYCIASFS